MNWYKHLPWGCFRSKVLNIWVLGCTPEGRSSRSSSCSSWDFSGWVKCWDLN